MTDGISAMPPSLVKTTHDTISLRASDEKDADRKSNIDVNVLDASDTSVDLENGEEAHDYLNATYTPEEYKKLVWKIDKILLPLMWWCYGIQQSDKTGLSTMALFGLREDTGLVGQQYSWLTTIFYICYLAFEFPSNFVLQRGNMGKILSGYMLAWGIIVGAVAACNNWWQLMLVRGLQGAFECCISPGFLLIISSWYQTREHPSRSLIFQSANAGYGVIVELCMYGIGHNAQANPGGFAAWRSIALFLGASTVVCSFLCFWLLGTPNEVWWLTKDEKRMANARIAQNQSGTDLVGKKWKWYQVREAYKDPVLYFSFANAFLSSVPNGGLTTFGTVVIKSFGFDELQVILLTIPRSVASVCWFVVVGLSCSRWKNLRMYFMMFSTVPPFIGMLMMGLLPTNDPSLRWTKWGGYFMTVPFVVALFMAWSLVSSNTPGRTKKTVISSTTFVGYCVGNMVGSQIFKAKDAPHYLPGLIGCCICFGLEVVVIASWRFWYVWQNKKRDAAQAHMSEDERMAIGKINGDKDFTDWENPSFRYTM